MMQRICAGDPVELSDQKDVADLIDLDGAGNTAAVFFRKITNKTALGQKVDKTK